MEGCRSSASGPLVSPQEAFNRIMAASALSHRTRCVSRLHMVPLSRGFRASCAVFPKIPYSNKEWQHIGMDAKATAANERCGLHTRNGLCRCSAVVNRRPHLA